MKTKAFLTLLVLFCVSCYSEVSSDGNLHSPSSSTLGASPHVSNIDFCDLLKRSESFDGKDIRLTAILISGREYTYLYDPRCTTDDYLVWYEFESETLKKKFDTIINPENPEYQSVGVVRAKADFVGMFETKKNKGFGHEGFFKYNFKIKDAYNVTAVPNYVPYPWLTVRAW